jgi:hypothetical protein
MGARSLSLFAVGLACCLTGPPGGFLASAALAAAEEGTGRAPLLAAGWEISVLSYRLTGSAYWLTGADGSIRVEILQRTSASAGRDPLECALDRRGDGWTLVLGQVDEGTYDPWDREWRRLPAPVHLAVRVILDELCSPRAGTPGPAANPDRRPWSPRPPGGTDPLRRLQLPRLRLAASGEPEAGPETAPSFRQRLAARGGGRGGTGEVMSLLWARRIRSGKPALAVLEVRSTRRPGVLRIDAPVTVASVTYLDPELFVTLWPLRDLISWSGPN